ncbi:N-acetylglucosaminyltransferase [Polymorphum gilvum]|uniref:Putative N-acetylglucosaminyltransferase n=1 Tax=Polymorphum gilvum (strain LMG 25793 / CGMCC 1.9160 / SL003B-26A1) TaxID=991905 RepID=F2IVH9_POLGS|nr:N-acetylglucosaminyltransferase [Polymorphum gilvum]ADZ72697.1 Putative N-acetylglucosaminyltransferase [Polymorphum gilvum SL003B-26A1]
MRPVFDGFTFFNELDVLELRLRELAPVVHRFVLVEADRTFTGHPKPLHFSDNKARFAPFLDKIEHVVVRDMPGEGASAWDREAFQRNAILRGLGAARPDDLVLVGDVDEIPKPEALRRAAEDPTSVAAVTTFEPEFFLYFLNLRTDPVYTSLIGPRLIARRRLASPEVLRRFKPVWRKKSSGALGRLVVALRIRAKFGAFLDNRIVRRGAWHFTFLGGAEAIRRKLLSYSHTEVLRDELLDLDYLETMLKQRRFIFEGEMGLAVVEDWSQLPRTLRDDPGPWRAHFVPDAEA